MKKLASISNRLRAPICIGLAVILTCIFFQWKAAAASKASLATDPASFLSDTALLQRDPGTPVGPPRKIIICHCPPGNPGNCHTIRVNESAVPAHLANHPGDHLGPCGEEQVICRHGLTVVTSNPVGEFTPGPCDNPVFMCNLRLHTIVVNAAAVSAHLAKGHQLGLCPGKNLICHNGHSIIVSDAEAPAHLAHGDTVGYCLGAQGPLITNLPPPTASN